MFGSSYVKRMGNARMNIHVLGYDVVYFGVPGLRVSAVLTHPRWKELKEFSPTQVFLHVGGNSIDTVTTEESVVQGILALRDQLLDEGVQRVFVGEILPRGDVSRSRDRFLTTEIFETKRKRLNRILQERLGRWLVHFYIRSAFRPTPLINGGPSPLYDADLVHLSKRGLKEYRKAIKRAFRQH